MPKKDATTSFIVIDVFGEHSAIFRIERSLTKQNKNQSLTANICSVLRIELFYL